MTPVEATIAEADLPTVATRASHLYTIAMENSFSMRDANPSRQIATAEVRQRRKKTSLGKKAGEVWMSIIGPTQPDRTPGLQAGNHVFKWMV